MLNEMFSIPSLGFIVFRREDGSIGWKGSFKGMAVVDALPMDDSSKCLILLDLMASEEQAFENLLCVERTGNVVWRVALVEGPDTIVRFQMSPQGLSAWTWSGWLVKLDPLTGQIIEREFVK